MCERNGQHRRDVHLIDDHAETLRVGQVGGVDGAGAVVGYPDRKDICARPVGFRGREGQDAGGGIQIDRAGWSRADADQAESQRVGRNVRIGRGVGHRQGRQLVDGLCGWNGQDRRNVHFVDGERETVGGAEVLRVHSVGVAVGDAHGDGVNIRALRFVGQPRNGAGRRNGQSRRAGNQLERKRIGGDVRIGRRGVGVELHLLVDRLVWRQGQHGCNVDFIHDHLEGARHGEIGRAVVSDEHGDVRRQRALGFVGQPTDDAAAVDAGAGGRVGQRVAQRLHRHIVVRPGGVETEQHQLVIGLIGEHREHWPDIDDLQAGVGGGVVNRHADIVRRIVEGGERAGAAGVGEERERGIGRRIEAVGERDVERARQFGRAGDEKLIEVCSRRRAGQFNVQRSVRGLRVSTRNGKPTG